jgi:Ring finger domain
MPSQRRSSSRLRSSAAKKIQKRFKSRKRQKQRQRSSATRKIQTRARAKIQGNKTRKLIARVKTIMQTDNNCPICFEPMTEKVATLLPCGHRFHTKCIKDSMPSTRGECPLCRTGIVNIPYVQPGRANRTFGNVPLSQQQPQAQALDLEQLIERGRWQLEILERSVALQRQQLPDAPEIPIINFNQALDNEIRAHEIEDAVLDLSRRLNNEIYRSFNINDEILVQDISNIIIRTAELLRRTRNNRNNAERIAEHLNNPEFRR